MTAYIALGLPKATSLAALGHLTDKQREELRTAAGWTCPMIKDIAERVVNASKDRSLGTRVQYLSKFRSHLKALGVSVDDLKSCDAYRPDETTAFNLGAAERRVVRSEAPIVTAELPAFLSRETVDNALKRVLAGLRATPPKSIPGELFESGTAGAGEQAKLLAQAMVFFAARPGELVQASGKASAETGRLVLVPSAPGSAARKWVGVLKRRPGAREVVYRPDMYGMSAEDAAHVLGAFTSASEVGRRRALLALPKILKPFSLTPRDLRAIGGEYSVLRHKGVNPEASPLRLQDVLADALRHDKRPSDTATSAYQRVDSTPQSPGVCRPAEIELYGQLVAKFRNAGPELQKAILELLGVPQKV